jgi:SAM-dependent methyltransferase
MNAPKTKLPQPLLPRGFAGRITALIMPLAHSPIYVRVSEELDLQPEDDLLEVACGSGVFLKKFASHVKSVAGVDYSELMTGMAKKKHKNRIAAGTAEIKHGEASELPWEDDRFSAATSMGSFMGFPKPLESLKEIYRVLRPGGRAVISIEWNADDGLDHSKKVDKYGMGLWTEAEVLEMMTDAGFSEVAVRYAKGMGMPKMFLACGVKKGD